MRLFTLLLVLFISARGAFAAPAADSGARDMRGARYGEILVVTGKVGRLQATVYSTIGLNDCPDAAWKKIDAARLKKEMKAWSVVMNGPRYFLMNRIVTNRKPGPVVRLETLDMRAMATIDLGPSMVLGGFKSKPYEPRAINRDTEWVYDKGATVYELVSPTGKRYVMQSYALIVDPSLNEAGLSGLGGRLKLPKGWTYRSRKLDADLHVKTVNGKAEVVQDPLQNTYQLAGQ